VTRLLRLLAGYVVGAIIVLFVMWEEFDDWRLRRRVNKIFGDGPF
jgi:hypothetical protein